MAGQQSPVVCFGVLIPLLSIALGACATVETRQVGSLSSYSQLKASDGILTRTRQFVARPVLREAQTVRLIPTTLALGSSPATVTAEQLRLVANALDRALCRELSRRFRVVEGGHSDLSVKVVIASLSATDTTAAGASVVAGAAGMIVGLPVPRIPYGLGSLTVEAEAIGKGGQQAAAMVWARGADILLSRPRVSPEGDAYTLATFFAQDFGKLLVTGEDPIANPLPMAITAETIGEFFGSDAAQPACRRFGRDPGLAGVAGGITGAPPIWADRPMVPPAGNR